MMGALIQEVIVDSIAAEVGLEPGDTLRSINDHPIIDILDYQFYSQDEQLVVEVKKASGEIWDIEIEKDYDDDLGIIFEGIVFDKIRVCRNRCVFCFIDQLPPAMRDTLYVKDDDYRYSFLFGNFVTLTNLLESDWDKIETMRLSPLYVSVHSTSGRVRSEMMSNQQASHIMEDLTRLKKAGIEVHTQIVLCPGLNDGAELEKTVRDLASLYPSVISVGIVPVGLTGHRQKLSELRPVTAEESRMLIGQVEAWQQEYRPKFDRGFVYLADEFYIKGEIPVPEDSYYDDYCQIENGIGLTRILLDEFAGLQEELPRAVAPTEAYLITGRSAAPILEQIADRLNKIDGLSVTVVPVVNRYFGGGVSVTGLLTGRDILSCLGQNYAGKRVVLPEVICREGGTLLLDNVTIEDIAGQTGADIRTTDGSAESLLKAILD